MQVQVENSSWWWSVFWVRVVVDKRRVMTMRRRMMTRRGGHPIHEVDGNVKNERVWLMCASEQTEHTEQV